MIQLETSTATASNYPTGRHSRYSAKTTATNAWQRLYFEWVDRPDGAVLGTAVIKTLLMFAPNTLTANTYYFDNYDSYSAITARMAQPAEPTTAVVDAVGYPNPLESTLHVALSNFDLPNTVVRLTDLSGRVALEVSGSEAVNGVAVEHLSKGMYLLSVKDGKNQIVKKVVK